jgi:death-on-curing protein
MHAKLLTELGGLLGRPREALLQSALARPQQLLAYGSPVPSMARLVAAYGFALARNHCFSDDNERIALAVVDAFLRINGSEMTASEEDAVDAIRSLAAGELSGPDFAAWMAANLK